MAGDVRQVASRGQPLPLYGATGSDADTVLVINRGAANVYIGVDESVQIETGIPVPPLASVTLSGAGSWWGVSDPATGVQTIDVIPNGLTYSAGAVEIASQIAVAQAQLTLVDLAFNRLVPFTDTAVDVSLYGSYYLAIQYEAANAGPPANTAIITLEWGDTIGFSNTLYQQTIEINSIFTTDCGRAIIQDKMYGPFMRVSAAAGNGAASNVTLVLYASYRTFTGSMRCRELGPTPAVGLSTDNCRVLFAGNVGAGATVRVNVRLGSGETHIFSQIGTAAFAAGRVDTFLHSPALGVNARFWQQAFLAPSTQFMDLIELPRRALTLQLTNTDANLHFLIISAVTTEE